MKKQRPGCPDQSRQFVAKAEILQQSISSGAAGENVALATLDERLMALEASATNATNTSSSELETLKMQLNQLVDKVAGISTGG